MKNIFIVIGFFKKTKKADTLSGFSSSYQKENVENISSFLDFFLKKSHYNETFFIRSYRAHNKWKFLIDVGLDR